MSLPTGPSLLRTELGIGAHPWIPGSYHQCFGHWGSVGVDGGTHDPLSSIVPPSSLQLVSIDLVAWIEGAEKRLVAPNAIAIRRQVRNEDDFLIILSIKER